MLRNLVRERYGYNSGHTLYVKDLYDIHESVVKGAGKYANRICDHFASYPDRIKYTAYINLTKSNHTQGKSFQ